MKSHSCLARKLFNDGYSCSQAIVAAFCDETGLDLETSLKLSSSFGGGMGRLREVCGAVTGMFMVVGLKYGYADIADKELKKEHYKLIQYLADEFKKENNSIICRDLLDFPFENESYIPDERTKAYYESRPCLGLVECAARILDDYIKDKKVEN